MIVFFALWLSLFLLRGAAYFWGSGLTLASTKAKERLGFAGIMLVIVEVDFSFEISVNCKKCKRDLFLPLLFTFVLSTSAALSYAVCRWFKLL